MSVAPRRRRAGRAGGAPRSGCSCSSSAPAVSSSPDRSSTRSGGRPETFFEADAGWKAIVFFGVTWVLGPTAGAVAADVRDADLRSRASAGSPTWWSLAALAAVFTAEALFQAQDWPLAVVWVLAGAGGGRRWRSCGSGSAPWREFLAWLSGAPVVFLVLFLATSPTSELLQADSAHALTAGPHVPIVMIVLDELPTVSLLDGSGHDRSVGVPGLRPTGGRQHVVPQPHDHGHDHRPGRPGGAHGSVPRRRLGRGRARSTRRTSSRGSAATPRCTCPRRSPTCARRRCAPARRTVASATSSTARSTSGRTGSTTPQPGGGMIFDPISGGETRGADFETWIDGIDEVADLALRLRAPRAPARPRGS